MNSPGLRERKKQKTRWAIQEHALRLFAEQGYDATTVDQIAAAAEISPSTFFRYFPTKEDLVIQDQYDDMLIAGLLAAPAELSPIAAVRKVVRDAFSAMPPDEEARLRERSELAFKVQALRARSLENLISSMDLIRVAVAERVGRSPDDLEVRSFAGAVVGSVVSVVDVWLADETGNSRFADLLDASLAHLERGVPL